MTDRTTPRRLAAAFAALLALSAGTVVVPAPAPAQAAKVAPANDQELQSFAASTKEIDGINREYRGRMKAAPTQNDAQKLQIEALDKIAERIKANGLTVERYSQIAQMLKTDTALRDKVKALMAQ